MWAKSWQEEDEKSRERDTFNACVSLFITYIFGSQPVIVLNFSPGNCASASSMECYGFFPLTFPPFPISTSIHHLLWKYSGYTSWIEKDKFYARVVEFLIMEMLKKFESEVNISTPRRKLMGFILQNWNLTGILFTIHSTMKFLMKVHTQPTLHWPCQSLCF